MQDERYLTGVLRYIHQNPVQPNMCQTVGEYKWSSDIFYRMEIKGFEAKRTDPAASIYKFYPSRFLGYVDNNMDAHVNNDDKDGRKTNPKISVILGTKPVFNLELEEAYVRYCEQLGFKANKKGSFGVERKYWLLD